MHELAQFSTACNTKDAMTGRGCNLIYSNPPPQRVQSPWTGICVEEIEDEEEEEEHSMKLITQLLNASWQISVRPFFVVLFGVGGWIAADWLTHSFAYPLCSRTTKTTTTSTITIRCCL